MYVLCPFSMKKVTVNYLYKMPFKKQKTIITVNLVIFKYSDISAGNGVIHINLCIYTNWLIFL